MRQPGQPLAQQRVDLFGSQPVADPLQRLRVVHGGEPVVQRLELDARPGGLPLGPLVAVQAQSGVVREVRAELEEERAEIGVDAIEVPLVDHRGGLHDPRIGGTVSVAALLGAEHPGLLLRPPDEQHPLRIGEPGQMLEHHVVLTLPLDELDQRDGVVGGEPAHPGVERLGDRRQRRGGVHRAAELAAQEPDQTESALQLRHVHVQVHPVDALDLEPDVLGQHIGNSAG